MQPQVALDVDFSFQATFFKHRALTLSYGEDLKNRLFREEVLQGNPKQTYGEILLIHPISHVALASLAMALLALVLLFLIFGSYTRRATVPGVLEPVGGIVKVYAGRSGQLKDMNLHVGQIVKKGQILLALKSEHIGAGGVPLELQSEYHLRTRSEALKRELQTTLEIYESDRQGAQHSLSALQSVRANLLSQIQNQTARVQAAQVALTRYEQLRSSGFMPETEVQNRRNDLIEQQARVQAMEKDVIANAADIVSATRNLTALPLKLEVAKAQLIRSIAEVEAELDTQSNTHDWTVIAPCDGTIASLAASSGQSIDSSTLLISLVPTANALQATLYASSREVGFLKAGQHVKIKLDAFPYQKFGLVPGQVTMVAQSPVSQSEIASSTRLLSKIENAQLTYTVSVALDSQTISAYGRTERLQPGMQLSADVELDVRPLFEWILEPLFSLRRD